MAIKLKRTLLKQKLLTSEIFENIGGTFRRNHFELLHDEKPTGIHTSIDINIGTGHTQNSFTYDNVVYDKFSKCCEAANYEVEEDLVEIWRES